jgi:hypothetical protein
MKTVPQDGASRWRVEGWHVVSMEVGQSRIYIRELIDIGADEFNSSQLTYPERVHIIKSAGVQAVLEGMAEIADEKRRCYRPDIEGMQDFALLERLARGKAD